MYRRLVNNRSGTLGGFKGLSDQHSYEITAEITSGTIITSERLLIHPLYPYRYFRVLNISLRAPNIRMFKYGNIVHWGFGDKVTKLGRQPLNIVKHINKNSVNNTKLY